MNDRKVYSLNKIAYLISAGVEVELKLDNDNKCYAIVKDDVRDLLDQYNEDKELHSFLSAYKQIRKYINKNIK